MKGEKTSHANLRGEVDVLLGVLLIPLETVVGQFAAFLCPGSDGVGFVADGCVVVAGCTAVGCVIVSGLVIIRIWVSVPVNMYICICVVLT